MKTIKLLSIAFIAIALGFSCKNKNSSADADDKMKDIAKEMVNMKTYIIDYTTTLSTDGFKSVTKTTQWMDVSKDLLAMESTSETEIMGKTQVAKSLIITDKEWSYSIDLLNKTGLKSKNDDTEDLPSEKILSDDETTFRQMIEKEGGVIIGNETFLGKNCIIAELSEKDDEGNSLKTKMWYYKGIPLKMINVAYSMEATKFEENIRIPSSRFEVPKDIKMTEY
jgi:hypothetical protein